MASLGRQLAIVFIIEVVICIAAAVIVFTIYNF